MILIYLIGILLVAGILAWLTARWNVSFLPSGLHAGTRSCRDGFR